MARVLVIDDDPVIREINATFLGRQGHQVVATSDVRERLAPEFGHLGWSADLDDHEPPTAIPPSIAHRTGLLFRESGVMR